MPHGVQPTWPRRSGNLGRIVPGRLPTVGSGGVGDGTIQPPTLTFRDDARRRAALASDMPAPHAPLHVTEYRLASPTPFVDSPEARR